MEVCADKCLLNCRRWLRRINVLTKIDDEIDNEMARRAGRLSEMCDTFRGVLLCTNVDASVWRNDTNGLNLMYAVLLLLRLTHRGILDEVL